MNLFPIIQLSRVGLVVGDALFMIHVNNHIFMNYILENILYGFGFKKISQTITGM